MTAVLGENHALLKSTATTSLLYLTGTTTAYSGVNNVSIDMTGAGGSSTAIRFATSLANVRMESLKFTNCVEAIGDETSVSNFPQRTVGPQNALRALVHRCPLFSTTRGPCVSWLSGT
ncbi:hypothetical protein ACVDG8_007435 [Mesorhizobium sp. ORM8.1]